MWASSSKGAKIVTFAVGSLLVLGLNLCLVPEAASTSIPSTSSVDAFVYDHDFTADDNYQNGKAMIIFYLLSDDLDDIMDSRGKLEITLISRSVGWEMHALSIENSGLTENDYGKIFEMDGVLDFPEMNNNLYVKISVPTTTGGEVDAGMGMYIELWPTSDEPSPMDGVISPASHDKTMTENWWDQRDTIDVYITGRADALTLTGFDGAYLYGYEIDSTLDIQASMLDSATGLEAENIIEGKQVKVSGVVSEPGATVNVYVESRSTYSSSPKSTTSDNTTGAFEIFFRTRRENPV